MLAEKVEQHGTHVWLINTGWTGGPYGVGSRFKVRHAALRCGRVAECGQQAAAPRPPQPSPPATPCPQPCHTRAITRRDPPPPRTSTHPPSTSPRPAARSTQLRHTRAIIDAIHSGELEAADYETMPVFNLQAGGWIACLPGRWAPPGASRGAAAGRCCRAVCRAARAWPPAPRSACPPQLWPSPPRQRRAPPHHHARPPPAPQVPKAVSKVPTEVLLPVNCWADKGAYNKSLAHLARLFAANFQRFADGGGHVTPQEAERILEAGPRP